MKALTTLYLSIIIITILVILLVIGSYRIYYDYTSILKENIELCLSNSITNEVYHRLDKNNIPYVQRKHTHDDPSSHVTVHTPTDTVEVRKTEGYFKGTIEDQWIMQAQNYLAWKKIFLEVNDLDSIFKKELYQNRFYIKAAVKVVNNVIEEISYSNSDTLFYQSSFETKEFVSGIKEEVIVQGFYQLRPWGVRKHLPEKFYLFSGAGLFLLLSLPGIGYGIYWKKRRIKEAQPKDRIEILPNVFFYRKKFLLQGKYCEVNLTAQMVTLFDLFAADPGRFASSAQISEVLWEKIDDTNDRLTQLIKRTREKIEPLIEIEIENIPGTGYRLILSGK